MRAVLDAVVAGEVYDLEVFRYGVGFDELTGFACGAAAEEDVDVFQVDRV